MVNKAELSAVTASEAADASSKASGSKRKKVPKVDEDDDSGSDSGSDVVSTSPCPRGQRPEEGCWSGLTYRA